MGSSNRPVVQSLLFLDRHAKAAAVLLVLIASVRVGLTWGVFNATTDEGIHIACGMEWLDRGAYILEPQHPPLARVAVALGPYLLGGRSQGGGLELILEGKAVLESGGRLKTNLHTARAATLPFFWIACVVVFLWARRLMGAGGAVLALGVFTQVPAVLGQAGLATTDMALTAMLGAAVLAAIAWAERPSPWTSVVFGVMGGLAVLSKFSSMPFFVAAVALMAVGQFAKPTGRHLRLLGLAAPIALFVTWAFYRFSVDPFFAGLTMIRRHNSVGHWAYLLGTWSESGFWNYYLVNLGVKTPLAYIALVLAGIVACIMTWRRESKIAQPLLFSLGILGCAMVFGRINIGVRHILPVYIGFSIVAASGLIWLLQRRYGVFAGVGLLGWLIIATAVAHPDYFAYFNELAGDKPEAILIDSDLDWGQDMKRLAVRLRELHIDEISYLPQVYPDWSEVPLPKIHALDIEHPKPGWHAANITTLMLRERELHLKYPNAHFWPEVIEPTERIGKGILLWHLP
jgi:hypothetical protein